VGSEEAEGGLPLIYLPRTTERPVRTRGDEPRSNSVVRKRCVPYPARLDRGECSDLPVRAAPQSHERKSVVRGLQPADEADLEAVLSSPAPVGKEIICRAARAGTYLIRFFRSDAGLLQL